jgi:hypothetical protein
VDREKKKKKLPHENIELFKGNDVVIECLNLLQATRDL